nr:hypothetical protein [Janthinobacterium sp. BJB401]
MKNLIVKQSATMEGATSLNGGVNAMAGVERHKNNNQSNSGNDRF